jgi:hypothetical protein
MTLTRAIALTTLLATANTSCGYLLHPERRGQQSGRIDGATMVMDLLWLLVGVVPGVVALIVDFSSGAIYVRGGSALRLEPGSRLAVRVPDGPVPGQLEFRLVSPSRGIVARQLAMIGPTLPSGRSIELDTSAMAGEPLRLEVVTETGATARLPTSIEVAR